MDEILPSWQTPSSSSCDKIIKIIKKNELISTISLKSSKYLIFGRKKDLCDVILDHQSISRQHCVLFFDQTNKIYLIDLKSSHGTFVNQKQIPSNEIIELNENDMIQFGQSTREYILSSDPSAPSPSHLSRTSKPLVPLFHENPPNSEGAEEISSTPMPPSPQPPQPPQDSSSSSSYPNLLSKEEERRLRQQEIAAYALEMSSTVPIFQSTKTALTKADLASLAQVGYIPCPFLPLRSLSLSLE
jgi:pSer/pThr/pTyr-binding forkhead associated (FHA) protein